ncbi:MAG: hypothetical protein WKF95_02320 [Rubrobacter sp.]
MSSPTRYARILERLFFDHYEEGDSQVAFERTEISHAADQLGIDVPKNLGDVVYSSRYRTPLPDSVREEASEGDAWVIFPAGKGRYRFGLVPEELVNIAPRKGLSETKIPDATPGMVAKYSLNDEQALLVKLRYNRLIDVFTGVTCYPLQSHLRATVPDMGQVETDELYVGVDRVGRHYALPVQAKGGNDYLGIVQIVQDLGLCADKFPGLICRPIGAQFLQDDLIALFEFEEGERYVTVVSEKHYRLVPPDEISTEDLEAYRARPPDG